MSPELKTLLVFIVITVIIFLSSNILKGSGGISRSAADKYKQIAGQSKHWIYAAKQDVQPLLGLLHATIGLSKVQTLLSVGTAEKMSKLAGMDLLALQKAATEVQQNMLAQIGSICPALKLTDSDVDLNLFI